MANTIERQRRLVEVGIIRIGEKRTNGQGKEYPAALDKFRLTSNNKFLLQEAAKAYGGEVRPWVGKPGQYELYTDTDLMKAMISTKPVGDEGDTESLSQHWEQWAGNTCTCRCDGQWCKVWKQTGTDKKGKPTYDRVEIPCECDHDDPEGVKCKLVSRLSVILPEVPALGLWRLNTGSGQFADEISALIDMIDRLGLTGLQHVTMKIEDRENRTGPGADTEKFKVIRVELDPQADAMALPRLIQSIQARSLGDVPSELPQGAKALEERKLLSQDEIERRGREALSRATEFCSSLGMDGDQITSLREFCRETGLRFVNDVCRAAESGKVSTVPELYTFLESGEVS